MINPFAASVDYDYLVSKGGDKNVTWTISDKCAKILLNVTKNHCFISEMSTYSL